MRKSGDEIEADIFVLVKNSTLSTLIGGKVYRDEMRPPNASAEDAIVIFKTGLDGQFQDGEILLNIYVPDEADKSGLFKKNITRCRTIGSKVLEVIETFTNSEYNLWALTIPQTFKEEGINQHYVSTRIIFKRNSIN